MTTLRSFFTRVAFVVLSVALPLEAQLGTQATNRQTPAAPPLAQTTALDWPEEDLSGRMMDGAHRFVERQIAETHLVGRDQWVAHEYGKVQFLYAQLGLADRTEIVYFQGGRSINGQGTFAFLHKHLRWPAPK